MSSIASAAGNGAHMPERYVHASTATLCESMKLCRKTGPPRTRKDATGGDEQFIVRDIRERARVVRL